MTSFKEQKQENRQNKDIFSDIFDNNQKKKAEICRFICNNYTVKIIIQKNEQALDIAVVNKVEHTKYYTRAEADNLKQPVLVLFRIFELFAKKSDKVSVKINVAENGVIISVDFIDSILSSQCDILVDEVSQSKEDIILFKLDQMEKAHQVQLNALKKEFDDEVKSLHELHETVVLLPGTSKVISLTAAKLILDGRNVSTILSNSIKKIQNSDDEKKNDNNSKTYVKLMPENRTNFAGYHSMPDPSLLDNLNALNISQKETNACHSCGTLCQCNANHYYSRNKLLMVTTESIRALDDHIAKQMKTISQNDPNESVQNIVNEQATKFQAICCELADVLKFCMDPEFVSFNGANIMALKRLQCIEKLTIHYNDNLVDISPIGGLKTLTLLHIENCTKIQDVHCVAALINLESLSFFGCIKVFDLTKLGNLSKLRLLDVRQTKVVNIVMFHKFPKLSIKYEH